MAAGAGAVSQYATGLNEGAQALSQGLDTQVLPAVERIYAVLGTGDKTLGSGAAALVGGLDKLNIGAATLLTEMAEIDANRALLSPAGQALAALSNAIKNDAALQLALVNSPYLPDLDPTTLATATGAAGKLLPELPEAYDAVAQISGGLSAPEDGALAGAKQLQAGIAALRGTAATKTDAATGVRLLLDGLTGSVIPGAQKLAAGADAFEHGDDSVGWPGVATFAGGAAELKAGAGTLNNGVAEIAAGSQELASGTAQVAAGSSQVAAGADSLSAGTQNLALGTQTLHGGAQRLATGNQNLAAGAGTLSAGAGSLAEGTDTLAAGATALSTGASELAAGATRLSDGSDELFDGSVALAEGAATLADGNGQLADGSVQLAAGASTAVPNLLPWMLGILLLGVIAIGFWVGHRIQHRARPDGV